MINSVTPNRFPSYFFGTGSDPGFGEGVVGSSVLPSLFHYSDYISRGGTSIDMKYGVPFMVSGTLVLESGVTIFGYGTDGNDTTQSSGGDATDSAMFGGGAAGGAGASPSSVVGADSTTDASIGGDGGDGAGTDSSVGGSAVWDNVAFGALYNAQKSITNLINHGPSGVGAGTARSSVFSGGAGGGGGGLDGSGAGGGGGGGGPVICIFANTIIMGSVTIRSRGGAGGDGTSDGGGGGGGGGGGIIIVCNDFQVEAGATPTIESVGGVGGFNGAATVQAATGVSGFVIIATPRGVVREQGTWSGFLP